MGEVAIAGMVVMALGCVTLGVLGTLAICYARTFIGRASKDSMEVTTLANPKEPTV